MFNFSPDFSTLSCRLHKHSEKIRLECVYRSTKERSSEKFNYLHPLPWLWMGRIVQAFHFFFWLYDQFWCEHSTSFLFTNNNGTRKVMLNSKLPTRFEWLGPLCSCTTNTKQSKNWSQKQQQKQSMANVHRDRGDGRQTSFVNQLTKALVLKGTEGPWCFQRHMLRADQENNE